MPPLFGQQDSSTANSSIGTLFSTVGPSQSAPAFNLTGHNKSQSMSNVFGSFGNSQTQPTTTTTGGGGFLGSSTANLQAVPIQPLVGQRTDASTGTAQGPDPLATKPFGETYGLGQSLNKQSSENALHSGYFSSLLEKGKKRSRAADENAGFGEIPSLQLGLGDIAQRVKTLAGGRSQSSGTQGVDSKA